MAVADFREYLKFIPVVKQWLADTVWMSYDQEADTLRQLQKAELCDRQRVDR
jgi:hypothetical protein